MKLILNLNKADLENLGKILIFRKVVNVGGSIDLIEHHGFIDASLPNYGASVYEIVFEKKRYYC